MVKNTILVEFDFIIDLDLAMIKFIRDNYNNHDYINQDIINITDDNALIYKLLHRKSINPLEILFDDDIDPTNLYYEILDNDKLLEYATPADTFGLLITFLREATFIDITILCKNEEQRNFINKLNSNLKIIIAKNKKSIDLDKYTVIYLKYYINSIEYNNINGKHIYIANARYNMDETNPKEPIYAISNLIADTNIIHTMDLYTKIKYVGKEV